MKHASRVFVSALLLTIAATGQSQHEAPGTVHIVTDANATALYHGEGCPSLRGAGTAALTLVEAQKRYFQPHCLCIAGKEGAPPCEFSAAGVALAAAAPTAAEGVVTAAATETVYVTKTGTKYHRAGCRSLSRSQIPMALKDASARYGPCSVCGPSVLTASTPTAPAATTPAERATPAPARPATSGRCQATTKKGTQCSRSARAGSSYCWQHSG